MKEIDIEEETYEGATEDNVCIDEESLLEDDEINPAEAAFWRGEGSA